MVEEGQRSKQNNPRDGGVSGVEDLSTPPTPLPLPPPPSECATFGVESHSLMSVQHAKLGQGIGNAHNVIGVNE